MLLESQALTLEERAGGVVGGTNRKVAKKKAASWEKKEEWGESLHEGKPHFREWCNFDCVGGGGGEGRGGEGEGGGGGMGGGGGLLVLPSQSCTYGE